MILYCTEYKVSEGPKLNFVLVYDANIFVSIVRINNLDEALGVIWLPIVRELGNITSIVPTCKLLTVLHSDYSIVHC